MDSISKVNVTAPAVSTAVPDADGGDETVQLSRDLNAAAQAPVDSSLLTSESMRASSSTNIAARSVGRVDSEAKIEDAKQEMWKVIREGVAAGHTMIMPYSFIELGEAGRKQVAKLTVGWVFDPVNSNTGTWFDCLTKNEMIRAYLKDTVSEAIKNEVKQIPELINVLGGIYYYEMFREDSDCVATTGSVPGIAPDKANSPDPTKSGDPSTGVASRTTIAVLSATGVDSETQIENAKKDMWQMVRDGVANQHDMIMPASFMLLDENGRKRVAKLTVDWVFTPTNANLEKWFNRFTGNKLVQPYLKSTVTKRKRLDIDNLGKIMTHVLNRIYEYEMLIWNS